MYSAQVKEPWWKLPGKSIWNGISPGGESVTRARERGNTAYPAWKHCQRKG